MGWGVPFWGDNRNDNRNRSGGEAGASRAEQAGMRLARVGWWDHGGRCFPAFGRLSVGCGWDWLDSWGDDVEWEEGGSGWGVVLMGRRVSGGGCAGWRCWWTMGWRWLWCKSGGYSYVCCH